MRLPTIRGLIGALAGVAMGLTCATSALAAYPGQNGKIVFAKFADEGSGIYTIEPDGTSPTKLADITLTNDPEPMWSPDGTKITFTQQDDIWVMNADGSGLTNLTNSPTVDNSPAWSPDGTQIAFSSCCPNFPAIWVVNADGTNPIKLVDVDSAFALKWSPDGSQILYEGGDFFTDADYQIHLVDVAAGTSSQFTFGDSAAQAPSWSPDGSKILFSLDNDTPEINPCGCNDIAVMNADGSGQARLFETPGFDTDPTWSPDGTMIVFRNGDLKLVLMNADGSGQARVTDAPLFGVFELEPDWQPLPLGPGPPASLSLAPETATNTLDDGGHCVTATVTDVAGDPNPGTQVSFTVTGVTSASGLETTGPGGQATFCYLGPEFPGTDQITAQVEPDGPSDTGTKTWVVPASTDGCKVTGGGRIRAANDDRATFDNNVRVRGAGEPHGRIAYTDRGPAEPLALKSKAIDALVCDGRRATIHGRTGTTSFRIELNDRGQPGSRDTYRIVLASGYDSGTQSLSGGNIKVRA